MPYISQPSRAGLDAHIDALANEIRALAKSEGHDAVAAELCLYQTCAAGDTG